MLTSSPQKARDCENLRSTCRLLRHHCAHPHATSSAAPSTNPSPKRALLLNPAPITSMATAPHSHAFDTWLTVSISVRGMSASAIGSSGAVVSLVGDVLRRELPTLLTLVA